jgi:hypothetical protein
MRKLILASVALFGVAGAAVAQEAPALIYGDNYEQNVQNAQSAGFDFSGTASIAPNASYGVPGATIVDVNQNENYSGR